MEAWDEQKVAREQLGLRSAACQYLKSQESGLAQCMVTKRVGGGKGGKAGDKVEEITGGRILYLG